MKTPRSAPPLRMILTLALSVAASAAHATDLFVGKVFSGLAHYSFEEYAAGALPYDWIASTSGAWEVVTDATRPAGEQKVFHVKSTSGLQNEACLTHPLPGSYTVESLVRPGAGAWSGVVFDYVDHSNYYWLRILGNGPDFTLVKVVGGAQIALFNGTKSGGGNWSASTYYNLKAARNRSTGAITCYIDGAQVCAVNNTQFTTGFAGVRDANKTAYFDYATVDVAHGLTRDSFQGYASGVMPSGWLPSTAGAWEVATDNSRPLGERQVFHVKSTAGTQNEAYVNHALPSIYTVQALVRPGAASYSGVVFDYVDHNNYYWLRIYGDGPNIDLQKVVNGVSTGLFNGVKPGGGNWSSATYYDLKAVRDSSTGAITCYADGVQICAVNNTQFTTGFAGVRDAGKTAYFDCVYVPTDGAPTLFNSVFMTPPVQMAAVTDPTLQKANTRGINLTQVRGFQLFSLSAGIDTATVDSLINGTLAENPNAMIVLAAGLNPYIWWLNAHPNDKIVYSDGTTGWVTPASAAWNTDVCNRLTSLVQHIEAQSYASHVVGYQLHAYAGGEFNMQPPLSTQCADFSSVNVAAFQAWAQTKYVTLAALNTAWGTSYGAFNQITIPTAANRVAYDLGPLFNPSLRRKVIDYYDYWNNQFAARIESFTTTIKLVSSRTPLVGVFHGYFFETQQEIEMGHAALSRLTQFPYLDYLAAPYSYRYRCTTWGNVDGPGDQFAVGASHGPLDTTLVNGMLWFNEDDTRTYKTINSNSKTVCRALPESIAVLRRNFASMLARGAGIWYLDLQSEGWFDDNGIMDEISLQKQKYQSILNGDKQYFEPNKPEVAVIVDYKSLMYTSRDQSFGYLMAVDPYIRENLQRSGTSVGYYLIEDLVAGRVPDAKVYVFMSTFHFTAAERNYINATLKQGNKTLVWLYGSGLINDSTINIQNLRDISGLNLLLDAGKVLYDAVPTASYSSLGGIGLNWPHVKNTSLRPYGPKLIYGAAGEGTVMATDSGYGASYPTVLSKNMGAWRSVYVGSLDVPRKWWRTLFTEGGAFMYLRDACYEPLHIGKGGIICLYPTAAVNTTLYLKEKSNVYNLMTGALVQSGVTQMSVTAPAYTDTRIYKAQPMWSRWVP